MHQVVCAPLFSVTLLDTVVADMLTSLVKVLLDLLWSGFYFFSGDFLRCGFAVPPFLGCCCCCCVCLSLCPCVCIHFSSWLRGCVVMQPPPHTQTTHHHHPTPKPTYRDVQGADAEPGPWETSVLYSKILAPVVVILPLWWRFMQCLRRYHDTGNRWPHLFNAAKYSMAQVNTETI